MIELDPAMKVVAVIDAKAGYQGLIDGVRKRIIEMGVGLEEIDERAKVADYYTSKVLNRLKGLGPYSMGPIMEATDLMIVLTVNPNAKAHDMRQRGTKGPSTDASQNARQRRRRLNLMKLALIALSRTSTERSTIARVAAEARWKDKRVLRRKRLRQRLWVAAKRARK